MRRDIGDESR